MTPLVSANYGAFYIMADVSPSGQDARAFALRLLDEAGVSVAPGTAFGEVARGAVRVVLAAAEADLRVGVERLCSLVRAG